jgi:hypothetical protein
MSNHTCLRIQGYVIEAKPSLWSEGRKKDVVDEKKDACGHTLGICDMLHGVCRVRRGANYDARRQRAAANKLGCRISLNKSIVSTKSSVI